MVAPGFTEVADPCTGSATMFAHLVQAGMLETSKRGSAWRA